MKTLDRCFSIIEVLERNEKMRLQEISDSLNLDKSTVHRFLTKMYKYNFIDRDIETKKYMLGLRFLNISSKIISNMEIRNKAKASLDKLLKITQETVHLGMLLGNNLIYIDKRESSKAIRMYSQIGKTAPLYCTAMGKAILSQQDKEEIEKILSSLNFYKYTLNTIDNKEALHEESEKVNKQGYAVDNEEYEKGICCIAAPIKNYTQKVIGSISITTLSQYKNVNVLKYKDLVIAEAKNISVSLGYLPEST